MYGNLKQLKDIKSGKATAEDRYIRDREAYQAGRRGEDHSYSDPRDADMYFMGLQAYEYLK